MTARTERKGTHALRKNDGRSSSRDRPSNCHANDICLFVVGLLNIRSGSKLSFREHSADGDNVCLSAKAALAMDLL